jgi:Tol biopolymer transport system component
MPAAAVLGAALAAGAGAEPPARHLTRDLTGDPLARDYWPCFSPDGRTVLFSRSLDGGKVWSLYTVPSRGGDARPLLRAPLPVSATRADWSRRGRIAFTGTDAGGRSSIWVIEGDGSAPRALAVSGLSERALYPAWYPDGRHLSVLDGADQSLRRVDARGGVAARLTDPASVLAGMSRVSPDGRWIAFAGQRNTGAGYDQTKNSIWLRGEDGALRPLETGAAQGRTPSWSPDGKRIAFQSNRGRPDGRHAVFVAGRDGRGLVRVTDHERDANHPAWSPDGRRLVFTVGGTPDRGATAIAVVELPR